MSKLFDSLTGEQKQDLRQVRNKIIRNKGEITDTETEHFIIEKKDDTVRIILKENKEKVNG